MVRVHLVSYLRLRVCLPHLFQMYVCSSRTNIPEGGLLTGFATRSDSEGCFGLGFQFLHLGGGVACGSWPLHAFLCKGYLYSLHHILSGPSIFSRIFSNIENILTSRRSTETKSRSKPAQNLQNLKISVGIDPKPTVEGGIAVSSSLVKTVLDAAQRQRQEYSRISLDSRSTKVKGCGKLVYS